MGGDWGIAERSPMETIGSLPGAQTFGLGTPFPEECPEDVDRPTTATLSHGGGKNSNRLKLGLVHNETEM